MSDSAAVEALLFAALEKPAAERNAFLDSACAGDAELRRQLDRLLQAHRHVGDFLQKPAVERLAAAPESVDDLGAAAGDGSSWRWPNPCCWRRRRNCWQSMRR